MALVAFLVCVAFIPWFPDGAEGPRWVVLSIALPVMLARTGIRWTVAHGLLAAFLIWAGVGMIWAPVFYDAAYIYWHFLLFAAAFALAAQGGFEIEDVYFAAGAALAVNAVFVGIQALGYAPFPAPGPLGGLFLNKNFGAEASVLVVVGIAAAQPLLAAALLPAALLPPLSRGAVVGACAAFMLALWKRFGGFTTMIVLLLAVGVLARMVLLPERLESGLDRLMLWRALLLDFDPLGHGLGAVRFVTPFFEYAHNDTLQVLYETGLPGLLLLGGFFGYCLWRGSVRERCVLVAFLGEGWFGFPLYLPATCFLAAVAAGCLCRDRGLLRDFVDACQRRCGVGEIGATG